MKNKKKGFTFLELLIAVSLFAVGMLSILQIFPVNRKLLRQSSQNTQAVFLAQAEMEQVAAVAYADLTVGNFEPRAAVTANTSDKLSLFQRQTVVTLVDNAYQATGTDVGLKKAVVTVYWDENNQTRSYSLSTVVYKR